MQVILISKALPAKRIFTRSKGWSTIVEITPPLSPAAKFSYLMWLKRRRRFAVKEKGDPEESGETGIAAAAA